MKKLLFVCFLTSAMFALAGCGDRTPAGGGRPVAVVDLGKVLEKLGWAARFRDVITGDQAAMNNELNHLKDQLMKQVGDARKKLAEEGKLTGQKRDDFMASTNPGEWMDKFGLPKDKVEEYVRMDQQAGNIFNSVQGRFNQVLTNRNNELLNQSRVLLNPVIDRVSRAAKVGVVIIMNPTVAYQDPAADITADVVDDMSKNPPTMPTLQKLEVPPINLSAPATQPAAAGTTTPTTP